VRVLAALAVRAHARASSWEGGREALLSQAALTFMASNDEVDLVTLVKGAGFLGLWSWIDSRDLLRNLKLKGVIL